MIKRTPDREPEQKERNKFDFELYWYIFVEIKINKIYLINNIKSKTMKKVILIMSGFCLSLLGLSGQNVKDQAGSRSTLRIIVSSVLEPIK